MTESNTDLHPTLATALACLDVDVDTELARYRRQRQKHQPVPASPSAEVAALTLTAPTSSTGQGKDHDIANYTQAPQRPTDGASPQDYLASSEKLRQTLDTEEPTPKAKKSGPAWFTPLSVGAIAILGVAIALIVFALRQPAPVAEPASSGDENTTAASPAPSEVGPEGEPLDVTGPDLANDDDNADTPAAETPTPAATPATDETAPIPGRPSDLTSALLPDPDSPIPSPTATPAKPEPNLDALPNVASPPPANDPYYYVLVDYGSEASLQQARSVVSDAYLRRFPQGIRVQLGAFDNAADAQRLVNAVQTQGIVAQIYQAQGEE